MKGVNATGDSCQMSLEFYRLKTGESFVPFTESALSSKLSSMAAFGSANNVPLNIGEFGVGYITFAESRGGAAWASDMIDLLNAQGINFQWYDYHSPEFGLYQTDPETSSPGSMNGELHNVFLSKFGVAATVAVPAMASYSLMLTGVVLGITGLFFLARGLPGS